jgi:hypothetical protein
VDHITARRIEMDDVINVLGRRLNVSEPTPPQPEPGRRERDGDGRQPPDDPPVLVAI